MDKTTRLYALSAFFNGRRRAASLAEIREHLECSPATAKRMIRELRDVLRAPLIYDAALGGYRFAAEDGRDRRFELPGIWFQAEELTALVTLREMLVCLEPGLLRETLAPLSRCLDEILSRRRLGLSEVPKRVRILSQHARSPGPSFGAVTRGVLSRRVLMFR